jgi:aryl-alcohol dehydrogenase-like predicted oxidoreductase
VRTRDFGAEGPPVGVIGLGLAALGRPAYLTVGHAEDLPARRTVAALRERTWRMLDLARSRGITYLDVARSYGLGEGFLGSWLQTVPDASRALTVGSKWGYTYVGGWRVDADEHEVKDHSVATFARQLATSRGHLGDHLDVYLIHSATPQTGVLEDGEVLDALTALASTGTRVGLSLSGPDQAATLTRALALAAAGRAPFSVVQATWNVLEPSVGPALDAAAEAGWAVVVKEALANGRLTDRGGAPAALVAEARRRGVGLDALAIAAALARPSTSVVLSGAVTPAQLDSNLAALEVEPDTRLADLARGSVVEPGRYWRERRAMPWT